MQPDERDLERIFERVREPSPHGLEDRILAGLGDPEVARRFREAEAAAFVGKVLWASFVLFVLAAISLAGVLAFEPSRTPAPVPTTQPRDAVGEHELLAVVGATRARTETAVWPVEVR